MSSAPETMATVAAPTGRRVVRVLHIAEFLTGISKSVDGRYLTACGLIRPIPPTWKADIGPQLDPDTCPLCALVVAGRYTDGIVSGRVRLLGSVRLSPTRRSTTTRAESRSLTTPHARVRT